MPRDTIVVIGASLAGLRAAESLRHEGHDGPLTVIGEERHAPYDRPPLSKQILTGKVDVDAIALRAADGLEIEWHLGVRATGVDLDRSRIAVAGGDEIAFDRLVIATGAHARRLPAAADLAGVHRLRTVEDAIALRADLEGSPRVAVIGAGFIGLEVASSCVARGLDVTVLEVAPVPLERAIGPQMGPVCTDLHRDHGVDVRLGVGVDGLLGGGPGGHGRVEGVRLDGGDLVRADVVLVGVGAAPTTAWLEGSGVDVDNGVCCDERLRVLAGGRALPHVVAAGDVARWDRPGEGPTRVEHWTNAAEQGQAAAAALLRGDEVAAYVPVPYFWSDQYDRKLQMVGHARPTDEVMIVDGAVEDRKFVAAYGRDGRTVAAFGFNRPGKVMALQRAIAAGAAFPPPL